MMKETLKASTVTFYQGHLDAAHSPGAGIAAGPQVRRADCRQLVFACRAKGLQVTTVRGIVRTLSTILSQAVDDELLSAIRRCVWASISVTRMTRNPRSIPSPARRRHTSSRPPACSSRTGIRGCLRASHRHALGRTARAAVGRHRLARRLRAGHAQHCARPPDHAEESSAAACRLSRQLRRGCGSGVASSVARGWRRGTRARTGCLPRSPERRSTSRMSGRCLIGSSTPRGSSDEVRIRCGTRSRRCCWRTGEPITYVSRQLGHKDASITLRVYAHWLPDTTARKGVDRLDETPLSASQTAPSDRRESTNRAKSFSGMVSRLGIEPTTRRLRVCCSAN